MDTLPVASGDAAEPLTPAQLRELYSLMVAVRHLDTSAIAWQRQGIIPGYAPELGQEAAQVGSGYAVDTTRDFVFPTYREMGVARTMGVDMVAYMSTHKATWHGGLYDPHGIPARPDPGRGGRLRAARRRLGPRPDAGRTGRRRA